MRFFFCKRRSKKIIGSDNHPISVTNFDLPVTEHEKQITNNR